MDVIEPYMPNRVLRQFGYVQQIPAPPIAPLSKPKRSRNPREYKVQYGAHDMEWMTPAAHQLHAEYYGTRAVPPYDAEERYISWYIARSHVRIQNLASLPGAAHRQADPLPEPSPYPAIYDVARQLHPVLPRSQIRPSYEEMHQAIRQVDEYLAPFIEYLGLDDAPVPDERGSRRGGPHGSRGEEPRSRRSRR